MHFLGHLRISSAPSRPSLCPYTREGIRYPDLVTFCLLVRVLEARVCFRPPHGCEEQWLLRVVLVMAL